MAASQYTVHDLKHRTRGDRVEVTLRGNAANVRLMNSSNFSNYKAGRSFRCTGGLANRSPVVLEIPSSGHWYVVVDLIGLKGRVKSSARILPSPMKPIKQNHLPSARQILQDRPVSHSGPATVDAEPILESYDVFISHASEDKNEVARPLAEALQALGLNVWYDELNLKIGDSLRAQIARGINRSRYAVIVLSESYFKKGWTKHELNGVMVRAADGTQAILPIWHKLTKSQVVEFDPGLSDLYALNTTDLTAEEIASEIAEVILGEVSDDE
jgi:hypothetical protein